MKSASRVMAVAVGTLLAVAFLEWGAALIPGSGPYELNALLTPETADEANSAAALLQSREFLTAAYANAIWILFGILPLASLVGGFVAGWLRVGLYPALAVVTLSAGARAAAIVASSSAIGGLSGVLHGPGMVRNPFPVAPLLAVLLITGTCWGGYHTALILVRGRRHVLSL